MLDLPINPERDIKARVILGGYVTVVDGDVGVNAIFGEAYQYGEAGVDDAIMRAGVNEDEKTFPLMAPSRYMDHVPCNSVVWLPGNIIKKVVVISRSSLFMVLGLSNLVWRRFVVWSR